MQIRQGRTTLMSGRDIEDLLPGKDWLLDDDFDPTNEDYLDKDVS